MAKVIHSTQNFDILNNCFKEYLHLSETEEAISAILSSIETLIENDFGRKEEILTLFFLLNKFRDLQKELRSEKNRAFFKIAQ